MNPHPAATIAIIPARGAHRVVRASWAWLRLDDDHTRAELAAATAAPDADRRLPKVRADLTQRRKRRGGWSLIVFGMLILAGWTVVALYHPWPLWALAAALLAVVCAAGRAPRQVTAYTDSAVLIDTAAETGPITPDLIVDALQSSVDKIRTALARNDRAIRFIGPVIKDGAGWAATVELPSGIEFADITKARGRVASGLSRPKLAVLIERGRHEGEIRLWVGDDAPTDDVAWPYATHPQRVDVLNPFPIGEDPRGRPVTVTLRNQHGLIGAATGAGKTVTLRALVAAAVLDPRAEVHIFDFKRSVGFVAFREAGAGVHVISGESEQHIEKLCDTLAAAKAEKARRDELVEQLPPREQPDGQIRSSDADRLGFGPLIVVLDEADVAFTDPTHGEQIGALTEYLVRRGRSVSIHIILSTQNFNTESVPTVISSNASLRMCGRVASSSQSNLILGGDSAGEGYSGKDIEGAGSFWVRSQMGVPVFTRVANVTAEDAWRIAEKARELRGGTRPTELESPPQRESFIATVRVVWPESADRVSCAELAGSVSAQGGRFQGWQASDITKELKMHGVETRPITLDNGRRARGLFWADLDQVGA